MTKLVKLVAFNILLSFLLLELGLFVTGKAGLLPMDLPGYNMANVRLFWGDINPDFGVWHVSSAEHRHVKSCFDVTYRTNSFGMRDPERPQRADGPRVIVLGDSFVEGFGVEYGQRFTDLLEKQTGIAHLNFGTSGGFGLTQAWLLYKTFAKDFDHDAVILSVVPNTDFADDDLAKGKMRDPERYRPYLVGSYPDYEVVYYNTSRLTRQFGRAPQYLGILANEFLHTARAFAYLEGYAGAVRSRPEGGVGRGRFNRFTDEEFGRMRYAIEQVVALAAPRPVLVVAAPRRSDYARAQTGDIPAPLTQRLRDLGRATPFTYVDLLEHGGEVGNLDELFLTCDPHWNADGHSMAARYILRWEYYAKAGAVGAWNAASVTHHEVRSSDSPNQRRSLR